MKTGGETEMKKTAKICLGMLFVAVVVVAAEILISYKCLMVQNYKITSERIRNRMKIVMIADLHDSRFGSENQKLIEKIEEQQPDMILMDGDMINEDSENSMVAEKLIRKLAKKVPVYYALGNHEMVYMKKHPALISKLEKAGAVVLDQKETETVIKGNKICIGGIYDYAFAVDGEGHMSKKDMNVKKLKFLEEFQAQESFRVMMAHRPDSFIFGEAFKTWNIDLVVSGHNHGGQIVIPGKGGLYGGDQGWFPKYVDGIHHFETVKNMVITRGLGSSGEKLYRMNNVPEIVGIELLPK